MAAATDLTSSIIASVFSGAVISSGNIDKTNGNTWTNARGKLIALVTNNSSGATDIVGTFTVTKTIPEGSTSIPAQNVAVTVAKDATKVIGPWSANFESNSGLKIAVAWSGAAAAEDVDITLIQLP